MERQKLNVFRMRLLGAEVRPVNSGTATLKDATSEAIRDWVTNCEDTHYILGSAAGPHPYPMMVSWGVQLGRAALAPRLRVERRISSRPHHFQRRCRATPCAEGSGGTEAARLR